MSKQDHMSENETSKQAALKALAKARRHLLDIDLDFMADSLEVENARLQKRLDLMEQEAQGASSEDLSKSKGWNQATTTAHIAAAAREFAHQAFGEYGKIKVHDISDEIIVEWMRRVCASLPFRETVIVILYFGLDGRSPRTLKQVADALGRSRANIAQNRDKALRRARHPVRADVLWELASGVRG